MPAIILYVATTVGLLLAWRRLVQPVRLAAALALVLLPLCFTGRALLTGHVYAPIDLPYASGPLQDYAAHYGIGKLHNAGLSDLYMQMIPWQHAVRQSLLRGEWPLWNPHLLCGSILAASMQSTVYDPLHLLALLLPHPQALTFNAAMTFFLAGFFTFTFARALGLGDTASLVAAAAYMFCAPLAFFVGWPLGRSWALLPFVLVAVRFVVRETSVRAAVLLTGALVLAIVAGHPESVLHIVGIGTVYGAFEVAGTRRFHAMAVAALCAVAALLLTAIVLLPLFEAAPQTLQHAIRTHHYAVRALPVTAGAVTQRAGVSLFPWYGGQPERGTTTVWDPTNVRVGSLVLALALAALLLAPRRETWFLAVLAAVGVWVGLNGWPLAQWLHAVPLFDITLNERLVFAGAFALAMLAAVAVDAWPAARGRARVTAGLVVAVGIALGLGTLSLRGGQLATGVPAELVTRLTLAELLPLGALALLLVVKTPPRVALPLVLGLVLAQRTLEDGAMYPSLPASAFYPEVPVLSHMQRDAGEPFRMVGLHYAFLPDAAALYGLEDARGYEAMTLRKLVDTYPLWSVQLGAWFNTVPDTSRPFLSFLNVKYAIGGRNAQPDDQWKLVRDDRNTRLFENTRVLSRAFVPRRVRYEREPVAIMTAMSSTKDFSDMAWILMPTEPGRDVANGPGTLKIRRDGTGFDIEAKMDSDGWVVISESAWRGWRGYVDGRRVQLHDANHAFLGAHVPRGAHRLQLRYLPDAFVWGRAISLITAVALIGVFALRRVRRSRPALSS